VWGWFGGLALLVAGPLLGGGYLLLLDFPSGPEFPRVPVFPLPSSGLVGNTTPVDGIHELLRTVSTTLPDKVFLLAPILLGGLGMARLLRGRLGVARWPAIYGGTLFLINPFVYARYTAGQLSLLLAYALLPWALSSLMAAIGDLSFRRAASVGMWLFALAAVDLHIAGLFGLLVVVAAVVMLSRRGLAVGAAALGAGALLSAYWLLPSFFVAPGRGVGAADLSVYASRPRGVGVLPALTAMNGFWRDEFPTAPQRWPVLYLLLVPILGLALFGATRAISSQRHRRFGIVLAVAGVLGVLLAAGTSLPGIAPVSRFLFDHVPGFKLYREPQKFLALTVTAYAVLGAIGLHELSASLARDRTRALARAGAIASVLAYGSAMAWGLWGQVDLARYPADWTRATREMHPPGRVLVLPFHLYAVYSFSGGRIVSNPALSFFPGDVLAGDNVGFSRIPTQSVDPFSSYVRSILARHRDVHDIGRLLAPLDVRYVVLLHEVDWSSYRFLDRQHDLRTLDRNGALTLFENRGWHGPTTPLTRIVDQPPPVAPAAVPGLPGTSSLPPRRYVDPVTAPYVATGDRCTDGWRLDGQQARCSTGFVAAFRSPSAEESLWRPEVAWRYIGFVISALSLVACVLILRRRPAGPTDSAPDGQSLE
jgi:hypothetical protein